MLRAARDHPPTIRAVGSVEAEVIVGVDGIHQLTALGPPPLEQAVVAGGLPPHAIAGLELAMDLLKRKRNSNKQIFMITDGKPTCIKVGKKYYKNAWGLDKKIINRTLTLSKQCRRLGIPITTFMIASDPYLQQFVEQFTQVNNGRAFYSSLRGLGNIIFEDYERGKRKRF